MLFSFKWRSLFVVFVLLYMALVYINNEFIFTDAYYYSVLGSQLSEDRINGILNIQHKFQWIGYAIQPIFLLFKWLLLSGVIFMVLFLLNQNVSYKECIKIVALAELVPVVVALVKVICFLIHKPQTLEDVQTFYPLAFTQLLNVKQIPKYLIYPLQQLNLFEVAYWLLIATGISAYIQKPISKALKITAMSYGVALFIWMLCVVFIQLQLN